MKYVTKKFKVTVQATPDDWQLYPKAGRDEAAAALNRRFEILVNKGATRDVVERSMCLRDYRDWGAQDTEGLYFLEQLLDETFGPE